MSNEDESIVKDLQRVIARVKEQDRLTAQERAELRWFREFWARTKCEGVTVEPAKTALPGHSFVLVSSTDVIDMQSPGFGRWTSSVPNRCDCFKDRTGAFDDVNCYAHNARLRCGALEEEIRSLEGRIREIETFLDEHHAHPAAAMALHDFMAGDCRHIFTIEDDAPGTRCCRLCGHPIER